jgi:hypothetical protein
MPKGRWQVEWASNWRATHPPNYSGYDPTSGYHTVGMRITSDGSTAICKCMWLDGIFQNCVNQKVGDYLSASQLSDATSRMEAYFSPVQHSPTRYYDRVCESINIWSCANWQTTACSTPGNPDPGGY